MTTLDRKSWQKMFHLITTVPWTQTDSLYPNIFGKRVTRYVQTKQVFLFYGERLTSPVWHVAAHPVCSSCQTLAKPPMKVLVHQLDGLTHTHAARFEQCWGSKLGGALDR